MVNSRRKGSKNERKIADWFKVWTGFEFARTPSSGGLRWKGMESVIGDIVCTDKEHSLIFPFSIECKVRVDISFEHLLLDVNSDILEFWDQCSRDALRGTKVPLLFMRYANMPKGVYFVVMRLATYSLIKRDLPGDSKVMTYKHLTYRLVIMNSNSLKSADYQSVLTKLKS